MVEVLVSARLAWPKPTPFRDAVAAAWDVYKGQGSSYDEDFKQRLAMFDDLLARL